jgi:transposase
VSAASAVRWCTLARVAGSVAPGPLGGDRRSRRIEAHGARIRGLLDQKPDITLKEIRAELAKADVSAGIVTIWRFFQRHRLTRKKSRRMPPSRPARTS